MKRVSLTLLGFLSLFAVATTANADLIQYTFEGNISSIEPDVATALGLTSDSMLNAYLEFDSAEEDINTGDIFGSYSVGLSFLIGNMRSPVEAAAYSVTKFDSIAIGSSDYNEVSGDFFATDFGMTLGGNGASDVILNDDLPLIAFELSPLAHKNWFIYGELDGQYTEIHGELISMQRVNAVSSPATFFLLFTGIVFLIKNKRRRFNCLSDSC